MIDRKLPTLLSLTDVVKDAANKLREIKNEEPDEPVMKFETCEIELTVGAEIEPGGKVNLGVVAFGADASYTNTQRIKLTFKAFGDGITAASEDIDDAPLPDM